MDIEERTKAIFELVCKYIESNGWTYEKNARLKFIKCPFASRSGFNTNTIMIVDNLSLLTRIAVDVSGRDYLSMIVRINESNKMLRYGKFYLDMDTNELVFEYPYDLDYVDPSMELLEETHYMAMSTTDNYAPGIIGDSSMHFLTEKPVADGYTEDPENGL